MYYVFVCFVSLEREIIRQFWYFMTLGLPYDANTDEISLAKFLVV